MAKHVRVCIKFHNNIKKIATGKLNRRKRGERTHRRTDKLKSIREMILRTDLSQALLAVAYIYPTTSTTSYVEYNKQENDMWLRPNVLYPLSFICYNACPLTNLAHCQHRSPCKNFHCFYQILSRCYHFCEQECINNTPRTDDEIFR